MSTSLESSMLDVPTPTSATFSNTSDPQTPTLVSPSPATTNSDSAAGYSFNTGPKGVIRDFNSSTSATVPGNYARAPKSSQTGPKGVIEDFKSRPRNTGPKGVLEDFNSSEREDGNPVWISGSGSGSREGYVGGEKKEKPRWGVMKKSKGRRSRKGSDEDDSSSSGMERSNSSNSSTEDLSEEDFRKPGKMRPIKFSSEYSSNYSASGRKTFISLNDNFESLNMGYSQPSTKRSKRESEDEESEEEESWGRVMSNNSLGNHLREVDEEALLNAMEKKGKIVLCVYDDSAHSAPLLNHLAHLARRTPLSSRILFLRLHTRTLVNSPSSQFVSFQHLTDPEILPAVLLFEDGTKVRDGFRVKVGASRKGGRKGSAATIRVRSESTSGGSMRDEKEEEEEEWLENIIGGLGI